MSIQQQSTSQIAEAQKKLSELFDENKRLYDDLNNTLSSMKEYLDQHRPPYAPQEVPNIILTPASGLTPLRTRPPARTLFASPAALPLVQGVPNPHSVIRSPRTNNIQLSVHNQLSKSPVRQPIIQTTVVQVSPMRQRRTEFIGNVSDQVKADFARRSQSPILQHLAQHSRSPVLQQSRSPVLQQSRSPVLQRSHSPILQLQQQQQQQQHPLHVQGQTVQVTPFPQAAHDLQAHGDDNLDQQRDHEEQDHDALNDDQQVGDQNGSQAPQGSDSRLQKAVRFVEEAQPSQRSGASNMSFNPAQFGAHSVHVQRALPVSPLRPAQLAHLQNRGRLGASQGVVQAPLRIVSISPHKVQAPLRVVTMSPQKVQAPTRIVTFANKQNVQQVLQTPVQRRVSEIEDNPYEAQNYKYQSPDRLNRLTEELNEMMRKQRQNEDEIERKLNNLRQKFNLDLPDSNTPKQLKTALKRPSQLNALVNEDTANKTLNNGDQ